LFIYQRKKNVTQAVNIHCPNWIRKRSHLGTGFRGKINEDQEGCRLGLIPAPGESW
jgi:hypothetical protein